MVVEIAAGALLAAVYVLAARAFGRLTELRIYALGLVIAAVIYAGFALIGGADARWSAIEVIGIVPYLGFAWLGLRYSPWWLAAGWAAHSAWDVGLHLVTGTPAFVPAWYPTMCLGFDWLVAGVIAARARGGRAAFTGAAP